MKNIELLAKIAQLHNEALAYVDANKRGATPQFINELSAINRTVLQLQRICISQQYDPKTLAPQVQYQRKPLSQPNEIKPVEQPKEEEEQLRTVLATNSEKGIEKAKSTRSKKAKENATNND